MTRLNKTYKISLPSTQGFWGRNCRNPNCNLYFKIHEDSLRDKIYCPYCGEIFDKDELNTRDQIDFVINSETEKIKKKIFDSFDKSIRGINRKYISQIKYKPKKVKANYDKEHVDSELVCPICESVFQVYGIFGFCPVCREENILIYDASLSIINNEIVSSNNSFRALRHAYFDIVITFENFCKKAATKITDDTTNFQNLFDARKFFKKLKGIDILSDLTGDELLTIKRIFQKRHSFHADGIIDEKYIKFIPEDKELRNQKVELSIYEFNIGAGILRKIITKLI